MLVIFHDPVHHRRGAQNIYRKRNCIGNAVDVVIATEKEIKGFGQSTDPKFKPAIQARRVFYEA